MEALVNCRTGKKTEAYRAYEELLYEGYQRLQMVLNDLMMLYMEDNDHELPRKLIDVSSSLASAFEMGRCSEVSPALDVAVWEKDVSWTAEVMKEILESVDSIGDFTSSRLYWHMNLKALDKSFSLSVKDEILKSLEDDAFDYMRSNEIWEKLKDRH
ncbi:MAG: hypothetical protein ACI4S4_04615 [Candidatus Ornithospirochaeta sp.]